MAPLNPGAKSITSAPGLVLAAMTASSSESGPLSARFKTLKVLGNVRSSSTSNRSAKRVFCRRSRRRLRWCGKPDFGYRSKEIGHMIQPFRKAVCVKGWGNLLGAQTERRGGAGPVRGLLGGKDPHRPL